VGSHQYSIKEDDSADKMVRGTRVVLHLKVSHDTHRLGCAVAGQVVVSRWHAMSRYGRQKQQLQLPVAKHGVAFRPLRGSSSCPRSCK
jgi:hypothetical protein